MKILIAITVLFAVAQVSLAIDPPLWPESITQIFHIQGDVGHLNATGKLWYDFTNQLFRT
jgi:hypothetical protein